MSKRKGRKAFQNQSEPVKPATQQAEAFSFGEPIPVLDKRDILDC